MKYLTIIVCLMFLSCNQSSDKPKENKLSEAEKNITRQLIQEMVTKHDAEQHWFNDSLAYEDIYTLELQEMVLDNNIRPILVYASIADIMKTDTGYKVILSNNFNLPIFDLYYELILSEEQAKYILSQKGSIFDNYAIVADIKQVDRVSRISIDEGFGDYASFLSVDILGYFIIRGKCLDILFVGKTGGIYD